MYIAQHANSVAQAATIYQQMHSIDDDNRKGSSSNV
jgi:hypothetical protein